MNDAELQALFNEAVDQHRRRELHRALSRYETVLEHRPRHPAVLHHLGVLHRDLGNHRKSIDCLRQAIAADQGNPDYWLEAAQTYLAMSDFGNALPCYERAIAKGQSSAQALNNCGVCLEALGQLEAADQRFQQAIKADAQCVPALNNHGKYLLSVNRAADAVLMFRRVLDLAPDHPLIWSNLLLSRNYTGFNSPEESLEEHCRFGSLFAEPGQRSANPASDRLRIGFVSADFWNHPVAFFMLALLEHMDPDSTETFAYCSKKRADDTFTHELRNRIDHWRSISDQDDDAAFSTITSDHIDVLVDLGGHSADNRLPLFARRAAPVQVAWLGYPNTTGLSTMDYRIVDTLTDPSGAERGYTEQLVRLPRCFLCYKAPPDSPSTSAPPFETNNHVTFGSFNKLTKVTDEVLDSWASILKHVENSVLLIKSGSFESETVKQTLVAQMADRGIAAERLRLVGYIPSAQGHLDLYNEIDIALDTFPYNGTTTTFEALWMGVPVVTLCGSVHSSRVGLSILSNLGDTDDLVGTDVGTYVEKAASLAENRERLRTLRETLRSKLESSNLMDGKAFANQWLECIKAISNVGADDPDR